MTWEQEMHLEAARLAKKLAPEMAKDLAKDMAKDMATDMAKNMATDMVAGMAKNFLEKDIPAEMVAECTGLALAELVKIKNGSGCSCQAECS